MPNHEYYSYSNAGEHSAVFNNIRNKNNTRRDERDIHLTMEALKRANSNEMSFTNEVSRTQPLAPTPEAVPQVPVIDRFVTALIEMSKKYDREKKPVRFNMESAIDYNQLFGSALDDDVLISELTSAFRSEYLVGEYELRTLSDILPLNFRSGFTKAHNAVMRRGGYQTIGQLRNASTNELLSISHLGSGFVSFMRHAYTVSNQG